MKNTHVEAVKAICERVYKGDYNQIIIAKTNLNKTNFFTEDLRARYPVAMKTFAEWIDQYKIAMEWNVIFNDQEDYTGTPGGAPKFHDLPFEMQVGILVRFIDEHNPSDLSLHYFQEYYTQDLTDTTSVINWFANFLCWYDKDNNPDHLLTNPPGEEDDLPF